MTKGLNRRPLGDNKKLGRCGWCFQGYCKCCTNDGADPEKFCSVFCQMKFVSKQEKEKE